MLFFQQFPNGILNFGSLCILGEIDPDHVHIPSIYVHKVFQTDQFEKRIERLTLTKPGGSTSDKPDSPAAKMRENIVRRAALEFQVGNPFCSFFSSKEPDLSSEKAKSNGNRLNVFRFLIS